MTAAAGELAALDGRIRAAVLAVARAPSEAPDGLRGLFVSDRQAIALAADAAPGGEERLARAAAALRLDEVDVAVLAACAAPELAQRYGRLYGYLHDDLTRRFATPGLVVRLLADRFDEGAVLRRLDLRARLRRSGALAVLEEGGLPLLDRPVKVADRLAAFLLGAGLHSDARERRWRRVPASRAAGPPETVSAFRELLRARLWPAYVAGPDGERVAVGATRRPLLVIPFADALDESARGDAMLAARLEGRVLCAEGLDERPSEELERELRILGRRGPVLYLLAHARGLPVERWFAGGVLVPLPTVEERRAHWRAATGGDDVDAVAAKFRLSLEQIEIAAARRRPGPDGLEAAARSVSTLDLGDRATPVRTPYRWEDLVLPEREHKLLRSISAYLRHRDLVLREWGYERAVARGQGLKALFAGDSGTGKTMAAQVLGHELGLELFRIDLATTVSKYIGETEKNLRRIFAAAERSNAILFFDEADALFGKRSEVRDSHDRYANLETAYLLQQMEGHPGAVILATNLRQNIDQAFLRRLDFLIEFPFPEPPDRERIWARMLPEAAPLADDVDLGFLARQFKLSGGSIRNVSLAAAFMAADDARPIAMEHLVRAVALEYDKLGRLTVEAEFEHFHGLVRR